MTNRVVKRVLIKVSGEGFCPPGSFGIYREELDRVAAEIFAAAEAGYEVAVVVGGGNLIRGARFGKELGIEQATADYMGMLGTIMNALALQEALERLGRPTRVASALSITRVAEPFIRRRCIRHLEKGRVVILAAGTGNPHVTTDSCAALRAAELNMDLLLKATKVDGVYDKDPQAHADAKLFEHVSYNEVIDRRLRVMDVSAIDICQQYDVPIVVFNLFKPGTIMRVLSGESVGTRVDKG